MAKSPRKTRKSKVEPQEIKPTTGEQLAAKLEEAHVDPAVAQQLVTNVEAMVQGDPGAAFETQAAALKPIPPAELKQEKPRLRRVRTESVGDAKVHLIDDMNNGGLGIQFEMPEREKPSDQVRQPVKEPRDGKRGMGWNPAIGQWRRAVNQASPAEDRVDVEKRFADAVKALRSEKEGHSR